MDLISLLKDMVAINSVYPYEQRFAEYIENYLQKIDFTVERVDVSEGRFNLVAQNMSSDHYLGFYGHMDTVPPHPSYAQDPYTVVIDDDVAKGLGVADMKGGIAAILCLAEYAQLQKLPVKLIFGVDEENISSGAHKLVESGLLQDITFLISAESGQVTEKDARYTVNYGRKGNIVIEIESIGRTVHAAESKKGVNAIEEMARFILALKELRLPSHAVLGETSVVVRNIVGGIDSFSIPDSCKIVVNFLTIPGVTSAIVLQKLEGVANKLGITTRISLAQRDTPYAEAYEVDRKDVFLNQIEQTIFSIDKVLPQYASSVADENVFAHRLGIPVISIGPVGGGDHTDQEWVSISSLQKTYECYKESLDEYAKK